MIFTHILLKFHICFWFLPQIMFSRAEALHAHGYTKHACQLAIQLAEEMLANPPALDVPPASNLSNRVRNLVRYSVDTTRVNETGIPQQPNWWCLQTSITLHRLTSADASILHGYPHYVHRYLRVVVNDEHRQTSTTNAQRWSLNVPWGGGGAQVNYCK